MFIRTIVFFGKKFFKVSHVEFVKIIHTYTHRGTSPFAPEM